MLKYDNNNNKSASCQTLWLLLLSITDYRSLFIYLCEIHNANKMYKLWSKLRRLWVKIEQKEVDDEGEEEGEDDNKPEAKCTHKANKKFNSIKPLMNKANNIWLQRFIFK